MATRTYGNAAKWNVIFYANRSRLGTNPSFIPAGVTIRIPCLKAEQRARLKALPKIATVKASENIKAIISDDSNTPRIRLLTADGMEPFTGRPLPNGGLVTDLVIRALNKLKMPSNEKLGYKISWVNDWAAHLDPLLLDGSFEAGFPWIKPNCEEFLKLNDDTKFRCQNFFFSDPIAEIFTVLVTMKQSEINIEEKSNIAGKTLCQPFSYTTSHLDDDGRNWIKNDQVILMRPQTPQECFKLLKDNVVDAVVVSDLTGQAVASSLGMSEELTFHKTPISIGSLSFIVPKKSPQSRTVLKQLNTALKKLRKGGEYAQVSKAHLEQFWASVNASQLAHKGIDPTLRK